MRPFMEVARPHRDILEGKLTMDVFAADLWRVKQGEAPADYQNPDLFFERTYLTQGLKNIIETAETRLKGLSGNSVIRLETPFGGGKTHTLIALYHKAREWNAKIIVLSGTDFDAKKVRLWEELERQLTGKVERTKGDTAPGKTAIVDLLSSNGPVLILMDEVLEYVTKAAGVKIADSTLAAQTFAFLQELTEAVATIGNALLVISLPSGKIEHYDDETERFYQRLQKITGRGETILAPVADDEIEYVVRRRLFSYIDTREVGNIVDKFVQYAKDEGLLMDIELSVYRERFLKSYPFKPDVIDILYKRWGSFSTFQRTRGILRLLSLVVYNLLDKNIPFIRLSDFDLSNNEIRRELIKHIGQQWDGIIAQDITGGDAGAKKVDMMVGSAYRPYKLGTAVATTIFMMSHSGAGIKGVKEEALKLSVAHPGFPSSIIDTALMKLKDTLFYLYMSDNGLYFKTEPTLRKLIAQREENISSEEIFQEEHSLLKSHTKGDSKLKVYIHPQKTEDIPDTPDLKLVVIRSSKPDEEFLKMCGSLPRVYRNTLIFLGIDERYEIQFSRYIRRLLAVRSVYKEEDSGLSLRQRKELGEELRRHQNRSYEEVRKFYRIVFLPQRDKFERVDIGQPTVGVYEKLDREIYEFLKAKGEILNNISPLLIKDKYLRNKDYIEISNLLDVFLKTPGELRLASREGLIRGIKEGVERGLFGFGYLTDEGPICKYINQVPPVTFSEDEAIFKPEWCSKNTRRESVKSPGKTDIESPVGGKGFTTIVEPIERTYSALSLRLKVPVGQISTIARIVSFLNNKFNECDVEITIRARGGKIQLSDYEDKIKEALKQGGIEIEEEGKE